MAGSSGSGGMASVCMTPRSPRTQTSCPRRTSSPSSRRTAPEDAHPCRMPCRSLSLAVRLVASSEELSWGLLGHFLEFPPRSPAWELSPAGTQPEGCSSYSTFEVRAQGTWGQWRMCLSEGSRALPFLPVSCRLTFLSSTQCPEGGHAPALPNFLLGRP